MKFTSLSSLDPAIQTVATRHTLVISEQNMALSVPSLLHKHLAIKPGTLGVPNPHKTYKIDPDTLILKKEKRE